MRQGQVEAFYGVVVFMTAIAFNILQRRLVKTNAQNVAAKQMLGNDIKGKYRLCFICSRFLVRL